ncbi:hypothetical protein BC477_11720 [Clavibacter michiganensis subsp. michiganensis]|uniref:Uncharacterized protein n=1 Tax=Clavibacter michiganensis subsp. michiganensis TaxID=33013 RepID=A0A251XHV0_CLAMM|nr:hypothetical protein BC477_11720 [Clavibacter michiganensis subsp. michiganensis]OUE02463.1 hypothetical protein CMMCAS07_10630 [Clavibacter michiganensis subsp. michiganensis]
MCADEIAVASSAAVTGRAWRTASVSAMRDDQIQSGWPRTPMMAHRTTAAPATTWSPCARRLPRRITSSG